MRAEFYEAFDKAYRNFENYTPADVSPEMWQYLPRFKAIFKDTMQFYADNNDELATLKEMVKKLEPLTADDVPTDVVAEAFWLMLAFTILVRLVEAINRGEIKTPIGDLDALEVLKKIPPDELEIFERAVWRI